MSLFGFGKRAISIDLSRKNAGAGKRAVLRFGVSTLLWGALLVALFLSYHFYNKYREISKVAETAAPISTAVDPVAQIIAAVDNHMLLPAGETPLVARVSDLQALNGVQFFRNAMVGDDVLVYCKAEVSILYSPLRNKVIEVANQTIGGACKK